MVWAFFVAAIIGIWIGAGSARFRIAVGCGAIVFIEVLVLMVNQWRCPLTAVAAQYTADRRSNFDIFLPEWIARYNKEIFGSLFVLGVLFTLTRYLMRGP